MNKVAYLARRDFLKLTAFGIGGFGLLPAFDAVGISGEPDTLKYNFDEFDFERAIKSNSETTDVKAVNDGVNLIFNKLFSKDWNSAGLFVKPSNCVFVNGVNNKTLFCFQRAWFFKNIFILFSKTFFVSGMESNCNGKFSKIFEIGAK